MVSKFFDNVRNGQHFNVIRRPIITEKASLLSSGEGDKESGSNGAYTFEVAKSSNKKTIKEAFESVFNVKVLSVNVINVRSKERKFRGVKGESSSYKKAIVRLASGCNLDEVFGGV